MGLVWAFSRNVEDDLAQLVEGLGLDDILDREQPSAHGADGLFLTHVGAGKRIIFQGGGQGIGDFLLAPFPLIRRDQRDPHEAAVDAAESPPPVMVIKASFSGRVSTTASSLSI